MVVRVLVGDCIAKLRELPADSVHCVVTSPNRGWFKPGQHWRKPKPHWNRDWLLHEYVERQRPAAEIATEMGCGENNILYWLKRHGIKARTVTEVRAVKHWGASGEANPMFGKTGSLNPRYIDGSSPERQRLYVQAKGREFLRSILKRDGYCCRRCQAAKKGRRGLHVHHIAPWAGNEALRFDPANAVTLCRGCHQFVHSKANTGREYLA